MTAKRAENLRPREIRFSEDQIDQRFSFGDNKTVFETLEDLKSGKLSLADLLPLQVIERQGLVYAANNHLLWICQMYEEFLSYSQRKSLKVPVSYGVDRRLRLNTRNKGLEVEFVKHRRPKHNIEIYASEIRYGLDRIPYYGRRNDLSIVDVQLQIEDDVFALERFPAMLVVRHNGAYYATRVEDNRFLCAINQAVENTGRKILVLCRLGLYDDFVLTTTNEGASVKVDMNEKRRRIRKVKVERCFREEKFVTWVKDDIKHRGNKRKNIKLLYKMDV